MDYLHITKEERNYLRQLAAKCLEYANLPVMNERRQLWFDHNALKGTRPMLVVELDTFKNDILPPFKCENAIAREMEENLITRIVNHELVDDDKVISPEYSVPWEINFRLFDINIRKHAAEDDQGRSIGFAVDYEITDLARDMEKLKPSVYGVNRDLTLAKKIFIEEQIGDILSVNIKNYSLNWFFDLTEKVVSLMSMENMFVWLMDCPEEMVRLFNLILNDTMAFADWMERENLLTLNNGNDYAGAGSYGFTRELPRDGFSGNVRCKDLWVNTNSQESVGLSPETFRDFIYPVFRDIAQKFGLVYYGCCEPVHVIWDICLRDMSNLRKVSVSPWCDQKFMGERLRNSGVIYSRKPSSNYLGVGDFNPEAFANHITETLEAAKGCKLEIIFRDIYSLNGDRNKPGRAIKLIRELL